jgi:hypothetical protein
MVMVVVLQDGRMAEWQKQQEEEDLTEAQVVCPLQTTFV